MKFYLIDFLIQHDDNMNGRTKKIFISVFTVAFAIVLTLTNVFAKGDIIRPYTFGFGNAEDVDEGVYDLVKAGDLKHLTFKDSKNNALNYWVHIPKNEQGDAIENLPVVLYLHGYSDGGGDNNIAIRYHNAILFKLIKDQDIDERKAIVIVPQTPNAVQGTDNYLKAQWVDISPDKGEDEWTQWNEETWNMDKKERTDNLNAVVELVKTVQEDNKADVDRTYVTGISMGGYATWDLISRTDDKIFAAAVPICGVGDPTKLENVKDIPIKTFHGGKDPVINPASTRKMYSALRKYGNITYTEYADEEHPSWNSAYSPTLDDDKNGVSNLDDLITWMFNQSRNGTIDGLVDKGPLLQIIKTAETEKKSNYAKEDWSQLQEQLEVSKKAMDASVSEEVTKEAVKDLDAVLSNKKEDIKTEKNKKSNNQTTILVSFAGIACILGFIYIKLKKK